MRRALFLPCCALALAACLVWPASAPAADNYTDSSNTTLDGDWVNHARITNNGIYIPPAMHSDGSGESSVNALGGVLETIRFGSYGIFSENGATATNAGSIATSGVDANGIRSSGGGTATNAGSITTSEFNAHGIYSLDGGTATSTDSITTSGLGAYGIYSDGGTATSTGSITTSGLGADGIYSIGGGTATNAGSIATSGNGAYGICSVGGTATNSGAIATSGASASGIYSNGGTVTNSGSIATSDLNAYGIYSDGGGTATSSGSIATSGNGAYGICSVGGTATNSGAIATSGASASGIYSNGGTATNAGTISASGAGSHAIHASNATVHLQTGTRILAGDVSSVAGTNHLFLDGAGLVDFDISGAWADLSKTGAGAWTFTQSPSGTIADLNLDGGTLALGSGAVLSITGDYAQAAGTTLQMAADGTSSLAVAGSATLAGTLAMDPSAASLGGPVTMLTFGGLGGTTFDAVSFTNPNFSPAVSYTPTSVQLSTDFTPRWDAPSLGLNAMVGASQGFASLSSSRGLTLLSQAKDSPLDEPFMVAAAGPLEGLFAGRERREWGAFAQPLHIASSRGVSGGLGYDAETNGIEAGLDRFVSEEALVGVLAGYASTRIDFRGSSFVSSDSEDQDMVTFGAYAGWAPGNWRVTDVLSASHVDHDSRRNAGLGQTAVADYESWVLANRLQAAYVLVPAEAWEITPRLGLDTTYVSRPGFSEHGAVNAVRYPDFDQVFWEGSAGVRASRRFQAQGNELAPYAGAGYVHELSDNDVTVTQCLGTDSARITTGNDDGRLTAEAGLRLSRDAFAITLSYNGEYGDTTESHALAALLRYEF